MRNNYQLPAVDQCSPEFPDRKIKGAGMEERPDIMVMKVEPGLRSLEEPHDIGMRDHHSLRLSCGTGSVDHVSGLLRNNRLRGIRAVFTCDTFPFIFQTDDLHRR